MSCQTIGLKCCNKFSEHFFFLLNVSELDEVIAFPTTYIPPKKKKEDKLLTWLKIC